MFNPQARVTEHPVRHLLDRSYKLSEQRKTRQADKKEGGAAKTRLGGFCQSIVMKNNALSMRGLGWVMNEV